jgi:hypothetical protein
MVDDIGRAVTAIDVAAAVVLVASVVAGRKIRWMSG